MMLSEKFFTGLAKDPSLKVKLTGSWETLIGPVDNFGEWSCGPDAGSHRIGLCC